MSNIIKDKDDLMLLKDISSTVRINPKPQFQCNIHEPEEYRTKEEYIQCFKENEKNMWWNWKEEEIIKNIDILYDFKDFFEFLDSK